MLLTIQRELEDGTEIDIEVSVSYRPGSPGRLYGPPEDCYEAEPGDIDVATDPPGIILTNIEYERLLAQAEERYRDERDTRAEDCGIT